MPTRKRGEEADDFLRQARQKLLEAEQLHAGSAAYNLACLEAIEGNPADAIRWLQGSKSSGEEISKTKITAEKDFDKIRNHPDFLSFVESLKQELHIDCKPTQSVTLIHTQWSV
jgi:hypothetical protein